MALMASAAKRCTPDGRCVRKRPLMAMRGAGISGAPFPRSALRRWRRRFRATSCAATSLAAAAPRRRRKSASSARRRSHSAASATFASAHIWPSARKTPSGSSTGTSEYDTSAELRLFMKSRLPDHAVATTGLPNAMACAGTRPKPSERCSEITMSAAAIRPIMSASGSMPSIRRILLAPATASSSARRAQSVAPLAISLITKIRSLRVAEGAAEGRDGGKRVLAREGRAEMNDVEHHQRVAGQAEFAAHVRRHRSSAAADDGRHAPACRSPRRWRRG